MSYVLIQESEIVNLVNQIGADIAIIVQRQGSLDGLATTRKDNLVSALNELHGKIQDSSQGISESRVTELIEQAKTALKNELTDGAGAALDTFKELADALNNDPSFASKLATQMNNRLRFDESQVLSEEQKTQALANLGLAASSTNYVEKYTTARGTL